MKRIGCVFLLITGVAIAESDLLGQAIKNAETNRKALLACRRYMEAWLEFADPTTHLIPRNLSADFYWNAKDAAADNYPFMVLSAYFTNKPTLDGILTDILKTEQKMCNRVDRLPDDWDFRTQAFRTPEYRIGDLIFGAAEYAKDGLVPITEMTGQSPWSDRMLGLLEDIWKHAAIQTEVGMLPDVSHEVAGDLMQSLTRMYWMTKNPLYKEWAFRLAEYFLVHHLPTETDRLQIDDHGCEVIGGLAEVYCIAANEDPDRHAAWRTPMHKMLDRILEVARDEHGLFVSLVNPRTGEWLTDDRTDNWGYTYNAYLSVAQVDKDGDRYVDAIQFVLRNLPEVADYPWEGDIADGIADSLEGGLNLMNRFPVPEAASWADHMTLRLLSKQRDTGIIEGWHGDGNFARTALMVALWKSLGAYVQPWRADVGVGAVKTDKGVQVVVTSQWPYQGTLNFDIPRHSELLHMPRDYPRLNQFPEWFTVAADTQLISDTGELYDGMELRKGLAISTSRDKPFRIELTKP